MSNIKKRKLDGNPIVITVASQKGGVGKTTIATNLAVCFAKEKYKVELIDADPQKSSMVFRELREKDDIACSENTSTKMHLDIPNKNCYDIIIIDAGGRDTGALRSAVLASAWGILLIPLLASQYDTVAFQDTMKIVNDMRTAAPNIKAYALFNHVNSQTNITKATMDYLTPFQEEYDFEILESVLHNRTPFKEAVGEGVIEMSKSKARSEMELLYKEIKEKFALTNEVKKKWVKKIL